MKNEDTAALAVVLTLNAKGDKRYGQIARDTVALMRLGRRALTRGVNMCNIPNYDGEKSAASIRKAVAKVLENYKTADGIVPMSVGGDPRGNSCLSINFKSGHKNGWGDGWLL